MRMLRRGTPADEIAYYQLFYLQRAKRCVMMWSNLSYLTISILALRGLYCIPSDALEGELTLVFDRTYVCYRSWQHWTVVVTSALIVVGYTIGYPVGVFVLMLRNYKSGRLFDDPVFVEAFNDTISSYKRKRWWYNQIDIFILYNIAIATALLANMALARFVLLSAVLSFSVFALVVLRPFEKLWQQLLWVLVQTVNMLLVLYPYLASYDDIPQLTLDVIKWTLVVIGSFVVLVMAIVAFHHVFIRKTDAWRYGKFPIEWSPPKPAEERAAPPDDVAAKEDGGQGSGPSPEPESLSSPEGPRDMEVESMSVIDIVEEALVAAAEVEPPAPQQQLREKEEQQGRRRASSLRPIQSSPESSPLPRVVSGTFSNLSEGAALASSRLSNSISSKLVAAVSLVRGAVSRRMSSKGHLSPQLQPARAMRTPVEAFSPAEMEEDLVGSRRSTINAEDSPTSSKYEPQMKSSASENIAEKLREASSLIGKYRSLSQRKSLVAFPRATLIPRSISAASGLNSAQSLPGEVYDDAEPLQEMRTVGQELFEHPSGFQIIIEKPSSPSAMHQSPAASHVSLDMSPMVARPSKMSGVSFPGEALLVTTGSALQDEPGPRPEDVGQPPAAQRRHSIGTPVRGPATIKNEQSPAPFQAWALPDDEKKFRDGTICYFT
jgi:hypothetical protein